MKASPSCRRRSHRGRRWRSRRRACRWRRRPPRSPSPSPSPVITAASLAPLMVTSISCVGAVRGLHRDQCRQRARRCSAPEPPRCCRRACRSTRRPHRSRTCRRSWRSPLCTDCRRAELSTSVASRSPVAVASPGVPLATPLASVTGPRRPGDHRRVVRAVDRDVDHLRRCRPRSATVNSSSACSRCSAPAPRRCYRRACRSTRPRASIEKVP